jgi:hypothetical protein
MDVDADGAYDVECSYLTPTRSVQGEIVETNGTRAPITRGVKALPRNRKSLTMTVPVGHIEGIRPLQRCQFEAFAEGGEYADVCASPEAPYLSPSTNCPALTDSV